jgi:hypothetical protein
MNFPQGYLSWICYYIKYCIRKITGTSQLEGKRNIYLSKVFLSSPRSADITTTELERLPHNYK